MGQLLRYLWRTFDFGLLLYLSGDADQVKADASFGPTHEKFRSAALLQHAAMGDATTPSRSKGAEGDQQRCPGEDREDASVGRVLRSFRSLQMASGRSRRCSGSESEAEEGGISSSRRTPFGSSRPSRSNAWGCEKAFVR